MEYLLCARNEVENNETKQIKVEKKKRVLSFDLLLMIIDLDEKHDRLELVVNVLWQLFLERSLVIINWLLLQLKTALLSIYLRLMGKLFSSLDWIIFICLNGCMINTNL